MGTKNFSGMRAAVAVAVFALGGLTSAGPAQAQATYTWTGGATGTWDTSDDNWGGTGTNTLWDVANGNSNIADFNTASLHATVNGPVYANGITFDQAGSLSGSTIDLAGATPTITANANASISSVLGDSIGLTKAGPATLTLSSNPTGTGLITVNAGKLSFTNGSGWAPTANFVINGGDLDFNNGADPMPNGESIAFGLLGGGTLSTNGTNFYPLGGTLSISTSGGAQSLLTCAINSYGINTNGKTVSFNIARGADPVSDLKVTGYLTNNNGSIAKSGNGILELDGVNTYTGGTAISGGTLLIAGGGQLNSGAYSAGISLSNNAALLYGSTASQTFSGIISGTGALTQSAGYLALTASNTYSGGATISGGTLAIGNAARWAAARRPSPETRRSSRP